MVELAKSLKDQHWSANCVSEGELSFIKVVRMIIFLFGINVLMFSTELFKSII